jgi:hypothetical protein
MARSKRDAPARRRQELKTTTVAEAILQPPETTLLDVVDKLLNKGVMATGDVTLGVAGVDLIYLRLSAMLCAADRILPLGPTRKRRRERRTPLAGRSRA